MKVAKIHPIVAVAGLLVMGISSAIVAQEGRTLTSSSGKYEVFIQPKSPDKPLDQVEIKVKDLRENKTASLYLSNDNERIDKIYHIGDRFVAVGTLLDHAGRSVAVIDRMKPSVVFESRCFDPVVSPNAERVAFVTWYPRDYDARVFWPRVQIIDINDISVGPTTVYPAQSMPEDLAEDGSTPVYGCVSPKLWSDDSKILVFFGIHGVYGDWRAPYEVYCVVVDFENAKKTRTYSSPVNILDFVLPGSTPDYIGFGLDNLEIEDGKVLKGRLHPQSYWRKDTIRVTLDSVRRQQPIGPDG